MTKDDKMNAKHQRMLELLAEGATSRVIAQRMGYQEGTMRVYLHNLYRKIGVANKTEAVVWYLGGAKPRDAVAVPASTGPRDPIGDLALEEDLHVALGVMGQFVGPYGLIWEAGQRMAGAEPDARTLARKERARLLWRALLRGDWAFGKRLYDADEGAALVLDSPSDAVLLTCLLLAGGYTLAAERLAARITDRRRVGAHASTKEVQLLEALRDALHEGEARALTVLGRPASDQASAPLRQTAMALVFHAGRMRGEHTRARQSAVALWVEAEAARKQLEAMGERLLPARPAAAPVAKSARERVAPVR